MGIEQPPVGAPVNLKWRGRWITAHVVAQRTGDCLDLVADGISPLGLLSVGYGKGGWQYLEDVELDWKQRHANDSETALEHPLAARALDELAENLHAAKGTIVYSGLLKLAMTIAQVARAEALGFDPDLLRLTVDEVDREIVDRAARLVVEGVPVRVIPR